MVIEKSDENQMKMIYLETRLAHLIRNDLTSNDSTDCIRKTDEL